MSKFKGILDAAKHREPETAEPAELAKQDVAVKIQEPDLSPVTVQARIIDRPARAPIQVETEVRDAPMPSPAPEPKRPVGRPPGKRSDPGYRQVTAYVAADLHYAIKLELLKERQGREFSQLVGDLLEQWLKSRS